MTNGGAVELYHDNGIRLSTTSTGINVSQAGSGSVSNFSHGGGAGGVRIAGPAASSGANLIFANNFDNSVSDEWAIQLDGATDDLVFKSEGAGGTNRIRFLDNGGICFGTDTATANALDDYEEGTWTPSMSQGSVNFTGAIYTKVGRLVTVSLYANSFSQTSSSSIIRFDNLPFTSDSNQRATGHMLLAYITTLDQSVAYIGSGVSYISLYHYNSGGDYTSLNYSAIPDSGSNRRIFLSMTYQAAT